MPASELVEKKRFFRDRESLVYIIILTINILSSGVNNYMVLHNSNNTRNKKILLSVCAAGCLHRVPSESTAVNRWMWQLVNPEIHENRREITGFLLIYELEFRLVNKLGYVYLAIRG